MDLITETYKWKLYLIHCQTQALTSFLNFISFHHFRDSDKHCPTYPLKQLTQQWKQLQNLSKILQKICVILLLVYVASPLVVNIRIAPICQRWIRNDILVFNQYSSSSFSLPLTLPWTLTSAKHYFWNSIHCYNFFSFSCLLSCCYSMPSLLLLHSPTWGDWSLLTYLSIILFLLDFPSLVLHLSIGLSSPLTISLMIVMCSPHSTYNSSMTFYLDNL